ncbi:uncharacterized protein LOC142349442 [Convolutriloba macropyga]|uniref:uncharacterized protein LOC142349442 n=1 Tax=Convolutriloba macropyga TaxID=536237 RepID=UPI003F5278EE
MSILERPCRMKMIWKVLVLRLISVEVVLSLPKTLEDSKGNLTKEQEIMNNNYNFTKADGVEVSRECFVCFQYSCLVMTPSSEPTCIMNIIKTRLSYYINFQPCPITCNFLRPFYRFSMSEREHFSKELNGWATSDKTTVPLREPTTDEQDTMW